jgi:hypothetical protein
MNELLDNPAVQAGVAPFLVALLVSAMLGRTRLLGLAIGAGFLTAVVLVMGLTFESLTSVRKMVLIGMASIAAVLALELGSIELSGKARAMIAVLVGAAAVWIVLRVLQQQPLGKALVAGVAAVLYIALLVDSTLAVGGDPIRASAAALMLGLGAGALALLGASAMLAQIGIAVGAASGATLLIQMTLGRRAATGWTLALPASVIAGLVGLLAVFTGELRWYCLLPTLVIPWATRLAPGNGRAVWRTAIFTAIAAAIPMLFAAGLAWFAAAAPST